VLGQPGQGVLGQPGQGVLGWHLRPWRRTSTDFALTEIRRAGQVGRDFDAKSVEVARLAGRIEEQRLGRVRRVSSR
jgi:hypothetical protein